MKLVKFFSLIFLLSVILFLLGYQFWTQELVYQLPTPIPKDFHPVGLGTKIELPSTNYQRSSEKHPITLLHFFNATCPCSKFNSKHIVELKRKFSKELHLIIVIQDRSQSDEVYRFIPKEHVDELLVDQSKSLAQRCGVYSTPQAVVLNAQNEIFYKGNYNLSRYCTTKKDNFCELAILDLINQKPLFTITNLTIPYGCQLK